MTDTPSTKRNSRRNDPKVLGRFVQELSWLLNSYSDLDFKALERFTEISVPSGSRANKSTRSTKQPKIETLVGVLPGLFVDEKLFPSNEDIAEFSASALGVHIPRWQKKSKFELIGHVVCNAHFAPERELSGLIKALNKITGEESTRFEISGQLQRGLSWNEVIQNLLNIP